MMYDCRKPRVFRRGDGWDEEVSDQDVDTESAVGVDEGLVLGGGD